MGSIPRERKRQAKGGLSDLFTIGYEAALPSPFVDTLRHARIDLLADVRAVTASRRVGFSKRNLAASLDEAGIGYLHLRGLGTPAEGRQAARAGRFAEMYRIYERQLQTPEAQDDMATLLDLVKNGRRVCLMCYERSHDHCHRRRIAEIVHAQLGARVEHLTPPPAAISAAP